MNVKYFICLFFFFLITSVGAQVIQVVDAETGEPIPFFHLYDYQKSKVLMGGPEGTVSLIEVIESFQDSVYISHLGYDKIGLMASSLDSNQSKFTFELHPNFIQLGEAQAQVFDEEQLFVRFQQKLKLRLSQNSWLVRVHFWELINGTSQVTDEYGLLGFGGLAERKGKFGIYDKSNYFLLSQHARRNFEVEQNGWHSTKDLIGIIANEILWLIQEAKFKKVDVLNSQREKSTFVVNYRLDELDVQLKISEEAELLEINWENPISLNLADEIRIDSGEIRFFPDSELLVPISFRVDFLRIQSQTRHQFFLLSSFIPSPMNYRSFLSENYKLEDYYNLVGQLGNFDDFNSTHRFFQSSKARFETRKMAQFSKISLDQNLDWIDGNAIDLISKKNPEADKAKVNEFYLYKKALLEELGKLGMAW